MEAAREETGPAGGQRKPEWKLNNEGERVTPGHPLWAVFRAWSVTEETLVESGLRREVARILSKAIFARLAGESPAILAWEAMEECGVDYCRRHHGIRNEDQHWCDMRDAADPEQKCQTCDGEGTIETVVGGLDSSPPEQALEQCPDCEEGTTVCDLTPLFYNAGTTFVTAPAARSTDDA